MSITNFFFNYNKSFLYFEFLPILIFLGIAIVLALIIVTLSYVLAIQNPDTEKLSSYECGFEPYEDARNIFDVKFYIVAINISPLPSHSGQYKFHKMFTDLKSN